MRSNPTLAGAAGQPGELDNIALSSLTLIADTRKLYRMRYLDLPQNFFISYAQGLNNAVSTTARSCRTWKRSPRPSGGGHRGLLLRFEQAKWSLVTGVMDGQLVMSLRTYPGQKMSAAELLKRLVRGLGEAADIAPRREAESPHTGTQAEIDRLREILVVAPAQRRHQRRPRTAHDPQAGGNRRSRPRAAPLPPRVPQRTSNDRVNPASSQSADCRMRLAQGGA